MKNFWKRVHLNFKSLFPSLSSSTLFLLSLLFLSWVVSSFLILVLFLSNIRSFILLYTLWRHSFPLITSKENVRRSEGRKREKGKNSRKKNQHSWIFLHVITLILHPSPGAIISSSSHSISNSVSIPFSDSLFLAFFSSFPHLPFLWPGGYLSPSLTHRLNDSLSLSSPVVLLLTMLITFINHQDLLVCVPSLSLSLLRASKLEMRSKLWRVHFWPRISLQTILSLSFSLFCLS